MRPILLDLKPAYLLAMTLASVALLAIGLVLLMPLPSAAQVTLIAVVACAAAWHIADLLLQLPGSLVSLELNGKRELHVMRKDGKTHQVEVLPESFVAPYLTILNLRISGKILHRHLLITTDRVDAEAFRQLRVWLRWGNQISSRVAADEA